MPFLSLPAEIQIEIFTYLQGSDLKAVRQICRAFRDNAEPTLFRHVIAAARRQSLSAFQEIALFPVFRKHVREMVFDGSMYCPVYAKNEGIYYVKAAGSSDRDQGLCYRKHGTYAPRIARVVD